jgi:hypothetical protein
MLCRSPVIPYSIVPLVPDGPHGHTHLRQQILIKQMKLSEEPPPLEIHGGSHIKSQTQLLPTETCSSNHKHMDKSPKHAL